MGDDKYYTIQVKGEAYRFRAIDPEDFERIALVQSLSVNSGKTIKAVTNALSGCALDDAWGLLTDRYLAKEITLQELTTDILSKLIERQTADENKPVKKAAKRTVRTPAADAE